MRRSDVIHLALMLLAFAAAYVLPFELLLLAYVVLGPAHYLSEISWLHDRKYFLPHRGIAAALVILAVVAILMTSTSWLGFIAWSALIGCAMLAATTSAAEGVLVFIAALVLSALVLSSGSSFALIGVLLPTLVHVSLFTLVFMALGAYRSASRMQAFLVVAYVLAVAIILALPPTAEVRIPAFASAAQEYFENVGPALGKLFGAPDLKLDTRLTSLLAFVYTYHYLNWFIKVDIIRWADVPRARLAMMVAASVGATALYFYEYTWGFILLLVLSLAHVLLEFPLNALSVRQLGGVAASGLHAALAGKTAEAPRRSRARR
ncbi:MAG TPA: hypothetical protein VJS63_02525 [Bradyrhizobium sp.]|nr:hypothetical protein [Bradyrhizobium sp.]